MVHTHLRTAPDRSRAGHNPKTVGYLSKFAQLCGKSVAYGVAAATDMLDDLNVAEAAGRAATRPASARAARGFIEKAGRGGPGP